MSVKLGSGHPGHLNIRDQTSGFAEIRRREEISGRRERLDAVAPRPHEPPHGLTKEPIIFDDRDQSWFRHTGSNPSIELAITRRHFLSRPRVNPITEPAPKSAPEQC